MSGRLSTWAAWVIVALVALPFFQIEIAAADTAEVAPGVQVTRKMFQAPVNEQPFYGLVEKSPVQREADEALVNALTKAYGDRQKAFSSAADRGWRAVAAGDMAVAARRFNEAFLLSPEQSQVFHGLAIVVIDRFKDAAFADELFQIARRQAAPLSTLNADYGRFLLTVDRPRDAGPVLEQAVKDVPRFGNAWSNLALARFRNGNPSGACLAADEADKLSNAANVNMDIKWVWREAQCSGH